MGLALCVNIGSDKSSTDEDSPIVDCLRTAVEESLPPAEILDAIGMPPSTMVHYRLENDARFVVDSGVVRVKLSVRAAPDVAEIISSSVRADVGDLVLNRLDGLVVKVRNNEDVLAESATLRFEVVDELPAAMSSSELASKAGFKPGTILGWSKGCNSWPG
jgi:hypothetical protein